MLATGSAVDDGWLEAIIAQRRIEAEDIVSLALEPGRAGALPPFAAGAHIEIALPNGLTRPYSLCNAPLERDRYQIAILLERHGRGGSRAAHALREGDRVQVRPPRNFFPLAEDGHSLLIGGGIGLTPLLAMAESLRASARGFHLHLCARSATRAAFADRLAAKEWAGCVDWHFDDGSEAQKFSADRALAQSPPGSRLYVCGPQGFIDHVLTRARAAGWPDERLHHEYFSAPSKPVDANHSFELALARKNRTITVPAGVSAAEALIAAGLNPPLSCEQGLCGSCLVPLLDGEADHRDQVQTAAERAQHARFALCCSRALTSSLTIDF